MKKAYIAGPLFDDHEREYLEKITEIHCRHDACCRNDENPRLSRHDDVGEVITKYVVINYYAVINKIHL